jgi:hypothetical protein
MIEGLATDTAVQSIRVMKNPTSIAHTARQGRVAAVLTSLPPRRDFAHGSTIDPPQPTSGFTLNPIPLRRCRSD